MPLKNPRKVQARTYGTKLPSQSEALRFIDSAKSASTMIDWDLPESNISELRKKRNKEILPLTKLLRVDQRLSNI